MGATLRVAGLRVGLWLGLYLTVLCLPAGPAVGRSGSHDDRAHQVAREGLDRMTRGTAPVSQRVGSMSGRSHRIPAAPRSSGRSLRHEN